jgi:hypothetical protein
VSSSQFKDGPEVRASALRGAETELTAEAERLRAELCLSLSTAEIVSGIKQTMQTRAGSQNLTVEQLLYDREYSKTFNTMTAAILPDVRQEFGGALADALNLDGTPAVARRARRFAKNAWERNAAAERREQAGSVAPRKGRPETYDPDVLLAFADTIARMAGRPRFTTGHHGDTTLSGDKGSPLLRTLAASVRWAMVAAWQGAAAPGTPPPAVKLEGALTAFRRACSLTD